jgi:cytosine/adenosine deaminase-related metal-dependent hydrolase
MAGAPWLRCRLPGFAPDELVERAAADPEAPDTVDLYRAGLILPVTGPPLADGALAVKGDRILALGPARALLAAHPGARHVAELPGAVLMPGLVNAHCHLALSFAQGVIPPTPDFTVWIQRLLALRRSWTEEEQRLSMQAGLRETLRGGCTLIGEIVTESEVAAGDLLADFAAPLRIRAFHEALGWLPADRETALARVAARLETPAAPLAPPAELRPGISPHAPYSSHPALYEALLALARRLGLPLSTHFAETADERRCEREHAGVLAALRERVGYLAEAPRLWNGGASVADWLADRAEGLMLQLVHGTWLDADEIARLATLPGASIAYCPGSVAWFHEGRDPHPVVAMLAAGLPVALGTDSLASSPTLNLPLTCTLARRAHPELEPAQILWMVTRAGALSLGFPASGELRAGGPADFVAFALPGLRSAARLGAPEAIEGALLAGYRVPSLSVIGGVAHAFAGLKPFPA